jgi:hypothetical protein
MFEGHSAVNVGDTDVVVFTAASATVLIGLFATNVTKTSLPLSLKVEDTHIAKNKRIAAGDSYEAVQGKIVLNAGDRVIARGAAPSSFDVRASVMVEAI